jgi:hypothetical protein
MGAIFKLVKPHLSVKLAPNDANLADGLALKIKSHLKAFSNEMAPKDPYF